MKNVKNFAEGNIIGSVSSSDSTISMFSDHANRFPDPPFQAVIVDSRYNNITDAFRDNSAEIITVYDRSGNIFSVNRAQEDSSVALNLDGGNLQLHATLTTGVFNELKKFEDDPIDYGIPYFVSASGKFTTNENFKYNLANININKFISSSYQSINNDMIYANTISGSFYINLPNSPTDSNKITIIDSKYNFNNNSIIVKGKNLLNYKGLQDFEIELDTAGFHTEFTWLNNLNYWNIKFLDDFTIPTPDLDETEYFKPTLNTILNSNLLLDLWETTKPIINKNDNTLIWSSSISDNNVKLFDCNCFELDSISNYFETEEEEYFTYETSSAYGFHINIKSPAVTNKIDLIPSHSYIELYPNYINFNINDNNYFYYYLDSNVDWYDKSWNNLTLTYTGSLNRKVFMNNYELISSSNNIMRTSASQNYLDYIDSKFLSGSTFNQSSSISRWLMFKNQDCYNKINLTSHNWLNNNIHKTNKEIKDYFDFTNITSSGLIMDYYFNQSSGSYIFNQCNTYIENNPNLVINNNFSSSFLSWSLDIGVSASIINNYVMITGSYSGSNTFYQDNVFITGSNNFLSFEAKKGTYTGSLYFEDENNLYNTSNLTTDFKKYYFILNPISSSLKFQQSVQTNNEYFYLKNPIVKYLKNGNISGSWNSSNESGSIHNSLLNFNIYKINNYNLVFPNKENKILEFNLSNNLIKNPLFINNNNNDWKYDNNWTIINNQITASFSSSYNQISQSINLENFNNYIYNTKINVNSGSLLIRYKDTNSNYYTIETINSSSIYNTQFTPYDSDGIIYLTSNNGFNGSIDYFNLYKNNTISDYNNNDINLLLYNKNLNIQNNKLKFDIKNDLLNNYIILDNENGIKLDGSSYAINNLISSSLLTNNCSILLKTRFNNVNNINNNNILSIGGDDYFNSGSLIKQNENQIDVFYKSSSSLLNSNEIENGKTYLFILTNNNGTLNLYQNNELISSGSSNEIIDNLSLKIGKVNSEINQILIYTKSFTTNEIELLNEKYI